MSFEDLEPNAAPRNVLKALLSEDLDPYAVTDLEERISHLEAEIQRTKQAIISKSSQRSAADALFSFGGNQS